MIDTGAFTNGPQVAAFEQAFAALLRHARLRRRRERARRAAARAPRAGARARRRGDRPGERRSSRRSRRSRRPAACRCSPTSPTSDYNLDPAAAAAAVDAANARRSCPCTSTGRWPTWARCSALADRHGLARGRGRLPGARRRPRRPPRRRGGRRGRVQLLSRQEPRRVRRRRRARRPTTPSSPHACARCASTGSARSTVHELERLHGSARHDPGARALHKLPLLDGWNEERRAAAALLRRGARRRRRPRLPPVAAGSEPVWHLYVVRTADPERSPPSSRRAGSATGRHYPTPAAPDAGVRPARLPRGARSRSPRRSPRECLSLPIFPGITEAQLEAVAEAVRGYFGRG